jgi:hypothetical protein
MPSQDFLPMFRLCFLVDGFAWSPADRRNAYCMWQSGDFLCSSTVPRADYKPPSPRTVKAIDMADRRRRAVVV